MSILTAVERRKREAVEGRHAELEARIYLLERVVEQLYRRAQKEKHDQPSQPVEAPAGWAVRLTRWFWDWDSRTC